jgi:hypothetical protein
MKCRHCGHELIDHVLTCPNCGFQHDDDLFSSAESPENKNKHQSGEMEKKEKNLASELKSKIKKAFYIDHDDKEALNYIELYLSMIGIDAEIIEYQEKIHNKSRKDTHAGQEPMKEISLDAAEPDTTRETSEEPLFELEDEPPEEPKPSSNGKKTESPAPEEPSLIESNKAFYELEDEEFSDEDIEKELEIEMNSEDLKELVPEDSIPHQDDDQPDEDLLVLEPDEEILELEDEVIEPRESQTEKEDMAKSKDMASQFEIEINQESQNQAGPISEDVVSLSDFENDMLNFPNEKSEAGSENFQPETGEVTDSVSEIPDSVESMLNDIKAKKKRIQRLILIAAAVAVFVALIITLYILTSKNRTNDHPSSPVAIKQEKLQRAVPAGKTGKKENPVDTIQEQEYQKYLEEAKNLFNKGDLKGAEKSVNVAKKIRETPETQKLEQEINHQKLETAILKEAEEEKKEKPVSDEEKAYKKVIASSDISILEAHLKQYPAGLHSGEIIKRIENIKKKNREMLNQQLKQNLKLFQKIQLRSAPQILEEENIQEILKKTKNIPGKFETKTIDRDRVLINYSTGLMWHIWKDIMEFRKSKWWANREYAGYFDWRLPTAEEASTLSSSDIFSLLAKSPETLEIWTSDTDSKDSRNTWVFLPLKGIFKTFSENEYKQVCSVRSL